MRTYETVKSLRNKQHASYVNHIELSHKEVNQVCDKIEEQETLINAAKRLLLEAHKDKNWTTEVVEESELGEWLKDYEQL